MHILPRTRRLTLTLPDARTLSFATYGTPSDPPLVFLHGFPSSRLEIAAISPRLVSLGLYVIAPDRPGFGASSPLRGRTIAKYPDDIAVLLDHLGIARTALLGGSGGGPYALACAGERVAALGVLAGAAPWTAGVKMHLADRWFRWCIRTVPGLVAARVDAA
ncbi:alpha/beta-hydrolase [Cutaneotrichosporon oleaginosum]|uniref:Alpha/beta-hydrolase n=1 Tax=Cutaneotrichosporon oleaginosum TaxID=879819 RepID=A0A0J0XH79_9TREE|nr:alpha/beta-hydrolase [Cutaneotrichosporon oleaginosum]KLT40460.1 alpha/beta-hydrolase [Cutaneotrichosporon oleaginosum]TXT15347.1 hypothetical protein COLE_01540 [Cutaneotrichosporon oleaginosum]